MLNIRSLVMNLRFISLLIFVFSISACRPAEHKKRDREKIISQGAELYSKYACATCHSLDGKVVYGPPLNDVFMKEIRVIRNGEEKTVLADREYLRKAIQEPRYEKVLDYKDKEMPLTFLNDEEIDILVEYIIEFNSKKKSTGLPSN